MRSNIARAAQSQTTVLETQHGNTLEAPAFSSSLLIKLTFQTEDAAPAYVLPAQNKMMLPV